jgi:hypothetical protein
LPPTHGLCYPGCRCFPIPLAGHSFYVQPLFTAGDQGRSSLTHKIKKTSTHRLHTFHCYRLRFR